MTTTPCARNHCCSRLASFLATALRSAEPDGALTVKNKYDPRTCLSPNRPSPKKVMLSGQVERSDSSSAAPTPWTSSSIARAALVVPDLDEGSQTPSQH